MELNFVALQGRIVTTPLIEHDEIGGSSTRILVLVRSARRDRFDVVPVRVTQPAAWLRDGRATTGTRVRVAGSLKRRCDLDPIDPSTSLEVCAESISLADIGDRSAGM